MYIINLKWWKSNALYTQDSHKAFLQELDLFMDICDKENKQNEQKTHQKKKNKK